ncbi:MAG: DUF3945 domain-containing protein, partial [Bacteroidales bacterium]|nr:DUF3945 domain-containing protein [Bacteroidales bacterium]
DPNDNRLKPVTGLDKNGKVKTVEPDKAKQNDFIKVDKNGNVLDNFFKNFLSQTKNPTHIGFYAIAAGTYYNIVNKTNKEEDLVQYRIDPQEHIQRKQGQEQQNDFKQFDIERIPESEYQKYGIKPQDIETELKAMSFGYKSPHLVEISPEIEGVDYPMKARLSLEEQPDGSLKFVVHPQQQQVDLEKPFQGIMLPNDVKENLLATGNGGRVVELEPRPGEKVLSLVSIDKLTNRLEAVPLDKLTISQNLKGTELSPEQQQSLKEGKKVLVEGMISKKTIDSENPRKFDAYVQFNAAKGSYDFSYDGLDRNKYQQNNKQEQGQKQEQQNGVRIPKKLLGVDLTEDQQNKLRDNKFIYVRGMMKDGQDQPFDAYVKVNHEEGKLDFLKWNPDKAKKQGAEIKVAEGNKTQVAVNSEGKTNEATKHSKEPLKQGQQKPAENQQQQQETKKTVRKSKGVKI